MQLLANLLVLVILLLTACNRVQENGDPSATTQPDQTITPEATVIPIAPGTPEFTVPVSTTESLTTVKIWIPPDFSQPMNLDSSGFSDLLLTFASGHSNLATKVEQKGIGGAGGILSYLRTGQAVAPSVLPDLILLPAEQLRTAAAEGLVYPIDDLLDPGFFDDFYPAALNIARPADLTLGIPFALTQMSHLVYNSNAITSTISLVWENLASESPGQFIIPAAGEQGAVLALQLYLAMGGRLTNEADQPVLETEPLVEALQFLESARSGEFIASQSSNIASLDEAWQVFQSGSAVMTLTTAELYLRQRSEALSTGIAPIPGPSSALSPLVDGWVWALSTADPSRRVLAAELLTLLTAEPFLGAWSYEAGFLPARRQSFAQWPPADPYVVFLQQELERAQPYPISRSHSIMVALGNAVFDVISLAQTPEAAARAAVTSLQP